MVILRTLTLKDIPGAKELSDAEGWNQTTGDWELLVTTPGNICLALSVSEKIVGTATVMAYGTELAWIGMVLVHRDYRGMGFSGKLLSALSGRFKSFRSVMLDATPAGQPIYTKYGFKNECLVYRMVAVTDAPAGSNAAVQNVAEPVDAAVMHGILEYDQEVTGINRRILLEYLSKCGADSVNVVRKNSGIEGFIMGRAGAVFYQPGPMVAETAAQARLLLAGLLRHHPGKRIVLDVPEDKQDFIQWLKNAGFSVQRQFMRMYLGNKVVSRVSGKHFLTAGPEFG